MSIDFITAQIILNSLKGNTTLVVYNDPIKEFEKICHDVKDVVKSYASGLPEALPVKLEGELGIDIFEKTFFKRWKVPSPEKDTQKEHLISMIMKSYQDSGDHKRRDYITDELRREKSSMFIKELADWAKKGFDDKLTERLDAWTGYDIVDLFDEVAERVPVTEKMKVTKALEQFISSEYREGEKNKRTKKIRDDRAREFLRVFKTLKHGPEGYEKAGVPSLRYIRHKYLPWILASNFAKKGVREVLKNEDWYYFSELQKYLPD